MQAIYLNETPRGMVDPIQVNENLELPAWAPSRWSIHSYMENSRSLSIDPVVIHNRWGHIVYQWPEGHIPSIGEISDALSKLGGSC